MRASRRRSLMPSALCTISCAPVSCGLVAPHERDQPAPPLGQAAPPHPPPRMVADAQLRAPRELHQERQLGGGRPPREPSGGPPPHLRLDFLEPRFQEREQARRS